MENQDLSATRFFFELGPDEILKAVESFGFRCTGRFLALNSMENRVYEAEIDGDNFETPSDRFKVVKFYRPGRWSKEQILEEHEFLFDLIEYDIPVIAPLKNSEGLSLLQLPDSGIYYAVFPKLGGRIESELDEESLLRVGRLLGRMHNVGATKPAKFRLTLNAENYGGKSLAAIQERNVLPMTLAAQYEQVVKELCNECSKQLAPLPVQRIHGDCHLGNLLWKNSAPFWVDFDDMVMGPKVQDLWLLIPGRDERAMADLDILLEGYTQLTNFDRRTISVIEPLRALRMIRFSAWIAVRWEDPAFPRAFPEFGSERYWADELRGLSEILKIIRDHS